MKTLQTIVQKITGVVSIISYVGFFFIMAITIADIAIRWITGSSILGVYEIVERSMICAVFASFAYTQTLRGHVQITMIISLFPTKMRFVVMVINNLLGSVISAFVMYAIWRQGNVSVASGYTTGILLIPLAPFYYVAAASMGVLCVTLLFDAVNHVTALFRSDVAEEIRATWN